jgi:hypothetical protein
VLYNFSDKLVSGRLVLPSAFAPLPNSLESSADSLNLAPGERREIPVNIKVPWDQYTRLSVPITFAPEDTSVPNARYLTSLLPDIGGRPTSLVTDLLSTDNRQQKSNNRDIVSTRPLASEEAHMDEQIVSPKSGFSAFAQSGAQVQRTPEGFTITVTNRVPGKPQRIEVEIPWPDGLEFQEDGFLSVEFRLGQSSEVSGLSPPNQ